MVEKGKRILVIGASGFAGSHVAKELRWNGYEVRALARNTAKLEDLAKVGCETMQGDISDADSMNRAFEGVAAAYISIHTISSQVGAGAGRDFVDVEIDGLQNIISACRTHGVRRLIYVTFLGASPDSPSAWSRGRWRAERLLLESGLDVTVIRPGQIVGIGGQGFGMMVAQAKRSRAIVPGSGHHKSSYLAVDDLTYYMVGVLKDPRSYGQTYDVGSEEGLTSDQMIDVVADVLGLAHPRKLHIPPAVLGLFAPLIERAAKLSKGSVKGFVDGMNEDLTGYPIPIRELLPRTLLNYRESVERALIPAS